MTPRRFAVALLAAGISLAAAAACSSTVQGQGVGSQGATATGSTPAVSVTDESSAPTTPTTSVATTTSAVPVAQPAPGQCPNAACAELATASLGNGFVAILRSGQATDGSVGASVLELTQNGVAVDWHAVNGETPAHLTCLAGAAGNCVVVDEVGAHGATATVWRLGLNSAKLTKSATAQADTPSMSGRDLNGDGFMDVVGLQNDYTPDYATGKVQWQTWLFDGKNLSSTGCTPLATSPPPRPTAAVTGACASY